ncbi:MAG: US12 family protein [Lachnospiraceae bacterium]|nr:US12 family protein [Lachnospiraceae bacterium]
MSEYVENDKTKSEAEARRDFATSAVTATSLMQHAAFDQQQGYAYNADEISENTYNTIIGAVILYGFVVTALIAFLVPLEITASYYPVVVIGYFICVAVGMAMCRKSENPKIDFIGYNLIVVPMAVVIGPALAAVGFATVRYAFFVMALVALLMVGLSKLYPQVFLSMGRLLFASLGIGLLTEVIMWCFSLSSGIFDFVFIAIFCGYIGYDWAVAQKRPKTVDAAIDSACMIYVDLINLLIRIIRIMASSKNKN